MSHDDVGTGPAVVLLHSGVCDRRMWDPQITALTESFRVVRPDLRGFGATPLPPEPFSFDRDVVILLDALGIERAALVGSSLGGRVALEVAAGWPDRVAALALLCPAFRGLEQSPAAQEFDEREEALFAAGLVDEAVELNVDTWLGPEASDGTRDFVRAMQRNAFEVQLAAEQGNSQPELVASHPDPAKVTARTLVVNGGLQMDHFQAVAAHLAAAIPTASLVTLPWAGHLPSLERPDEVTRLLLQFLTAPGGGKSGW